MTITPEKRDEVLRAWARSIVEEYYLDKLGINLVYSYEEYLDPEGKLMAKICFYIEPPMGKLLGRPMIIYIAEKTNAS